MAVSAFTGVMDSLLSKLSGLLTDHYRQRKGLRRDIEFLRNELLHMNAAMLKLAGRESLDSHIKVWRDQVREMAYDIEDHIDIFMHKLAGQRDDNNDGIFHKIARKIKELREHYQFASKIQELKARVEEQSQRRDRYRIDESTLESRVVKVDPRLPAMFEDANRLVGIDGPREEITRLLMEEGAADSGHLLKVVSIVGFGGLGKTTLANQVYTKIMSGFQCTAFVSVSRAPHMPKILKDILSGVGYGGGTEMEDEVPKLIEILRAQLMDKRYLIIIDDLWSTQDWCTIKCVFVENNKDSRVITTTRCQEVAIACCFPCQGHVYPMKPLDEHHSRRLFFKRLFGTTDSCPEQFIEVSNDLLRKCKGVPLAITSIASLLANQSNHVESWEKIRNSLGSELDTNPSLEWMKHVLNLSYNDLSYELKTCLLYLGMYPEDDCISKDNLVRKWIAEGFVMEKHGLDIEEAAENCFNELINRSMIQPYFDDGYGELSGCHVHDLMLDLIISKCKGENFITIIDGKFKKNEAPQIRRISHQLNNSDMALAIEEMSPSQVRSYMSFVAAQYVPSLSKFELLRILDMHMGMYAQHRCLDLSAINHLFLLKYLEVQGFDVELPKKFGKLENLMTINISGATLYPSNQSSDFTSVPSLRHLEFPSDGGTVALTNGLSKLCNLRTLICFYVGVNSLECIRDLGKLTNLRELWFTYSRAGDVEDNPDTILAASLDKLGNNNLRYLYLDYQGAASEQFWRSCFTRPRYLQRLSLYGLIPKVPTWMAHASRLSYLYNQEIQELKSDDFHVLGQLPCLIFLHLEAKTILEKNITIYPNTFPNLKYCEFYCELSCLTFEPAAMTRLQDLDIRFDGCGQGAMQLQEDSPVGGIEHLASLEKVSIDIEAKCGHGSRIESAWRNAISRHPKSQAIQIRVQCAEYDENGNMAY